MPDPATRQASLAAGAQMLQVEAASKRYLTAIVSDASARSATPTEAARRIRQDLPRGVVATRVAARAAGSQAMVREMAAIRTTSLGASVPPLYFASAPLSQEDVDAAREIADNYADDVLDTAAKAEKPLVSRVVAALTFRIDTIAATETSQQFNGQRARNERDLRGKYLGTAWLPLLVKEWDATMDRRACRVCASLRGKLRPIGIDWDGREPGQVHTNCRCKAHYFASVLFAGREYAA